MNSSKRIDAKRDLIFYICLVALPLIQFCIFYVFVNFNSILLAFQKYDIFSKKTTFVGFENFKTACEKLFTTKEFAIMFKNSFIFYGFTLLIGVPFAFFFAYYVYKKAPLSGLFKVVLYLPQVISSAVLIIIYKYFVEKALPSLSEAIFSVKMKGLLDSGTREFYTILFFSIYLGFGTQVLMYVSAMGGINESVVEAAEMDGAGFFREMWYVTLPSVFPTAITFITVGMAAIFTADMGLFSFNGNVGVSPEIKNLGYYMYTELQLNPNDKNILSGLSSMGIIFTLMLAPVVFATRYLLNKFGPRED